MIYNNTICNVIWYIYIYYTYVHINTYIYIVSVQSIYIKLYTYTCSSNYILKLTNYSCLFVDWLLSVQTIITTHAYTEHDNYDLSITPKLWLSFPLWISESSSLHNYYRRLGNNLCELEITILMVLLDIDVLIEIGLTLDTML